MNHKRVYTLYRGESLTVRRRKRKRAGGLARMPLSAPGRADQDWRMVFMTDALAGARRFRVLNIVDEQTREALAIQVDSCLPGEWVPVCWRG